jgi:hypothetical protein
MSKKCKIGALLLGCLALAWLGIRWRVNSTWEAIREQHLQMEAAWAERPAERASLWDQGKMDRGVQSNGQCLRSDC